MTDQTKPLKLTPPAGGNVLFRVLPKGAGKIFTGGFDAAANLFTTYERGDMVEAPRATAEALEARGLVEISQG